MFHRTLLSLWLILGLLLSACAPPAAAPTSSAGSTTPAPAANAAAAANDGAGQRTVAILVVDKFTKTAGLPIVDLEGIQIADLEKDPDKPPLLLQRYPRGEGCVALSPGKAAGADYISRGGGGSEHGRLVWSTITQELSQTYGAQRDGDLSDHDLWERLADDEFRNGILPSMLATGNVNGYIEASSQLWHVPDGGNIRLIPVDIGDFDTATVKAGITSTLDLLAQHGEQIDGEQIDLVVINMSWVILPKEICRPLSLDKYLDAVCTVMDENGLADLINLALIKELTDSLNQEPDNEYAVVLQSLNDQNVGILEPLRDHMSQTDQTFEQLLSSHNDSINEVFDTIGISSSDSINLLCMNGSNPGEYDTLFDTQPAWLQLLLNHNPELDSLFLGHWLDTAYDKVAEDEDLHAKYRETYPEPPTSEPRPLFDLLSWLASCPPTATGNFCPQQTISVAAAGNETWEFPFMPGLWESVVSVSASDGLPSGFTSDEPYSNWGGVALDGRHPLGDQLVQGNDNNCVNGFNCSLYEGRVVGTSYAAPRFSVLAARYLLDRDEPFCPTPPLGYNQWNNLTVADAADQYCQDFPLSP